MTDQDHIETIRALRKTIRQQTEELETLRADLEAAQANTNALPPVAEVSRLQAVNSRLRHELAAAKKGMS